jgi:Ni/Co efflux regulator RcnB
MRKIVLTALAASLLVPTTISAQTLERKREAWIELRETNADLFRRDTYVAPRGLKHPRVSSGAQLAHAFYDKAFWIEDFAAFRLPQPAEDQHYIRYGNDVLKVNVRTGRVIKVYKDFFQVG